MNSRRALHPVVAFVLALALVVSPLTPVLHAQEGTNVWLPLVGNGITRPSVAVSDVLFRTQVTVTVPTRWTRLDDLGVTILERHETGATVLVDYEQLADLARLRFEPRNSEEFGALVTAGADEKPWLARSLRSLGEQAQSVRAEIGSPLEAMIAQPRSTNAALVSLRSAAQSLTVEQRAALSSLPSLDDDGDGLTNTEESWWCTDAMNPNSDGDAQGYTDGQEVTALLDLTLPRIVRWGYGPPFRAWPPFVDTIAPGTTPTCFLDADHDSIPDLAETYMVGTRVGTGDSENTDGDKFDDGQEFFGTTYCPGGLASCGYGTYPRESDSSKWISPAMPSWVRSPGDSPFVAAYPVIEFNVDPSTILITTKEIKTLERTITQGEEISTGFAETKGNSTSVGTIDTNTTSGWKEHSSTEGGIEPALAKNIAPLSNVSELANVFSLVYSPVSNTSLDEFSQTTRETEYSNLISNGRFLLSSESSSFDIQAFLTEHASKLATYEEEVLGEQWNAARIINYNAVEFGINSQVILVLFELSHQLISSPAATIPTALSPDGYGTDTASFFGYVRLIALDLLMFFDNARYSELSTSSYRSAGSIAIARFITDNIQASQSRAFSEFEVDFTEIFIKWFGDPNTLHRRISSTGTLPSGFQLPYEGTGWRYSGGPHRHSWTKNCAIGAKRENCPAGAWSAIDIATPKRLSCPGSATPMDRWVTAAQSGVIQSSDGHTVVVDHQNGWKTYYVHIDSTDRVNAGVKVQVGSRIGHPACVGVTDGIHVHFAIFQEGTGFVDIEGLSLSDWVIDSTDKHYQGTMSQCSTNIVAAAVIPSTAEGCPAKEPGPCDTPPISTGPTPGPTPTTSHQTKTTNWGEYFGRLYDVVKGKVRKVLGGNLRSTDGILSNLGCNVNMSCANIGARSSVPVDYSSMVSAGKCANPTTPNEGTLGIGGGGAGLTFNDNGDGTFTALRTWSETTTTGEGWSTSHSELRTETEYSEITRSTVNTLVSSESWATATTLDPTDAARLTFNYSLANTGSDLAVKVTGLRANLLIGDLPVITVNLPDRTDIEPSKAKGPFESGSIPLTLDQLAAIDNGAPIRVVLADYGYDDSLYDQNAWGRGVLFHVDDGIADGDELFDTYLVVTNLVQGESYQDTLARYFPVTVFEGGVNDPRTGTLTSIITPEYDANGEITAWVNHPVNDRAWWELALSTGGETPGVKNFKDMPAKAKTDVYLRYMVDTDGDGYTDRAERDAGTDLNDANSHPRPLLVAAQHTKIAETTATVQLALQNLGDFDASSVEIWAIAPDDSITINDNLVGGGGRVRAGRRVVLGARIGAPDLTAWTNSTAKPAPQGQYDGTAASTFKFRADTAGTVGSTAGLQISWSVDGATWTPLNVGSGYTAWTPLALRDGLSIAFSPGDVVAGETFGFETALPLETFSYTINRTPHTPPLLVVSYNDAQGNHKFVTDVETTQIQEDLTRYYAEMRRGLQLDVRQAIPFHAGANQAWLTLHNPSDTTIHDGNLFVNVVTPDGTVAKEYVLIDQTFQPGPNVVALDWNTADFSPAFDPKAEYHLLVIAADRQGTIIEHTLRSLDTLAKDALPEAVFPDTTWDFGAVTQGEMLERTFALANVGFADLQSRALLPAGLSMTSSNSWRSLPGDIADFTLTLDTRTLPTGPYTGTVTLRTSDPANPLYTVQVSGTIEPLTGDAYARPVVDRPLDVEVWVAGDKAQGTWITFEHPLGPQPENLHPLKLYDQTSSVLLGLGKIASLPASCADIKEQFLHATDGIYTLYLGRAPNAPFQIYCHDMNNTPKEYLPLVNTGGSFNYSMIAEGGWWRGTNVYSRFQMLRIDPDTLIVNLGDLTYATSTGSVATYDSGADGSNKLTSRPYAHASTCKFTSDGLASANVDLRGTPFRLDDSVGFRLYGHVPAGSTSISSDRQVVNLTGGGACGDNAPSTPFKLKYVSPVTPANYVIEQIDPGMLANGVHNGLVGYWSFDDGAATDESGYGNHGTIHGGTLIEDGVKGKALRLNGSNYVVVPPSLSLGLGQTTIAYWTKYYKPTSGADNESTTISVGEGGGFFTYAGSTYILHLLGPYGTSRIVSVPTDSTRPLEQQDFVFVTFVASDSKMRSYKNGQLIQEIDRAGQPISTSASRWTFGAQVGNYTYYHLNGYLDEIRIYNRVLTDSEIAYLYDMVVNPLPTEINHTGASRLRLTETIVSPGVYRIQYGRKLDFAAASEMTATLRVPAGEWTSATLNALVSGVGSGDVIFKLDVGNNGTWDWEVTQTITNAGTFSSPDLAAAFANYVGGTGEKDVEVKVYLSKLGQVLLTNMTITRNQSVELVPSFALSGTPTEGATVPLNATVTNSGAADSGPLTVSYYATRNTQQTYIGSVFVPNVPQAGTVAAPLQWNTLGFTGPVTVTAMVDPYSRVAESDKTNNSKAAPITILTRPDLAFTNVTLSNPEPMAGETVTLTVSLKNGGQTAAAAHRLALYRDNPDGGGTQIRVQNVSTLNGGASRNIAIPWTPSAPGIYRLFLRADRDGQVNESDRSNNDRWLDVYVGMASPLSVDSGGAGDTAYSAGQGFGVIDSGDADQMSSCGDASYQSFRRDPSGRVVYRFDHLLPDHFYHLDLTLYECGQNAGRQQRVHVDGIEIAGPIDLGNGEVQRLSLLLDPALYADRSIEVAVTVDGTGGALVNQIALVDVDYRYADAGGARDVQYPSSRRPYGWLDGVKQIPWGTLPFQSLRENQSGNEVRYQFDSLHPDKEYQVHFTFFLGGGNNRVQQIWVDGVPLTGDFTLVAGQRNSQRIDLPKSVYADGSITVAVRRSDGASTGTIVNEIALEEVTQVRSITCQVTATPSWSAIFGQVTIAGQSAPAGTVITAENPRGDVVGCFVVHDQGEYGLLTVYGEDTSANPPIPGMKAGEPVILRVNGVMAVPTPLLTWQNDRDIHTVNLAAGETQNQYTLLRPNWNLISSRLSPPVPLVDLVLQPIAGKYCLVLGQNGIYDCALPAPFRSLKNIEAAKAYYVRVEGGASINLTLEGTPLTGGTSLALEPGWNWVGYLPQSTLPIGDALQSIAGKLVRAANGAGQIYVPGLAASTLKEMVPGQGYLLYLNAPATLVYPTSAAVSLGEMERFPVHEEAADLHCGGVEPTPYFTAIYGDLLINGRAAAVGTVMEAVTPRGEVAGCFTVATAGQYGFLSIFGTDNAPNGLPGFQSGEAIGLRVNGQPVELSVPLLWQDDKDIHALDLAVTVEQFDLYLPFTNR